MVISSLPADRKIASVRLSRVPHNMNDILNAIAIEAQKASADGAGIVIFEKSFVPEFPRWCLALPADARTPLVAAFFQNAMEIPGALFTRLADIARAADVYLNVELCEKNKTGDAIWAAGLLIDNEGRLLSHSRKEWFARS